MPVQSSIILDKVNFGYRQCKSCINIIELKIERDLTRKKFCSKLCQNKCRNKVICKICNKEFIQHSKYNNSKKRKTCSKECYYEWFSTQTNWMSKTKQCIELAKQGKTNKEISLITGFSKGSVASYLNRANFRKRGEGGKSYSSIRNHLRSLYKECKICGFNRIIEIAHIIPAKLGGELSEINTLGLCPNHHHLFDTNKLTYNEAIKLKDKVNNWLDHSMEKENVTSHI